MEAFNDWFNSLSQYFRQGTEEWYVIPLSLLAVWLVTLILLRLMPESKDPKPGKELRKFMVYRAWIWAGCGVALCLIAWFGYRWATTPWYPTHGSESMNLLAVLGVMLVPMIALLRLRQDLHPRQLHQIAEQPFTANEAARFRIKRVRGFGRLKLVLLVPLIGFLTVLFFLRKPDYLVSFVFDNSGSMEVYRATAQSALQATLLELDGHTDFVISWFTDGADSLTLPEILNETNYSNLNGAHSYHADARTAIQSLSGMPLTATPLYETVWSNFLFSESQAINYNYEERILFIVSDGLEYYLPNADLSNFLCDNQEFGDFWTNVGLISWSDSFLNPAPLFAKGQDVCGYLYEDGRDQRTFTQAINQLINPFKHDWFFIIWLALLFFIPALIGAVVPPKRAI